MPKAYVTGATGFLGGHVARTLREAGWDILCLRRTAPSDASGVDAYALGDVTDYESLAASIPRNCDAVFHIAADITHWKGASEQQNRINVGGTRNVARAALAAGVGRFVHCSSDAVWGLRLPLIREDMPRLGVEEPINYQRSKFWGEEEIRCAMDLGLDAVTVNPTNVLGPGDVKGWSRVPVHIYEGHLTAAPPGSGAFAYVEDVAAATVAAYSKGRSGHNYLLGGVNATYLEFMRLCAERVGVPFAIEPEQAAAVLAHAAAIEAEADRTGEPPQGIGTDHALVFCADVVVDSGKAIRELGFRTREMAELVDLTVAWLRQEGSLR